jgi:hypothetical protein
MRWIVLSSLLGGVPFAGADFAPAWQEVGSGRAGDSRSYQERASRYQRGLMCFIGRGSSPW